MAGEGSSDEPRCRHHNVTCARTPARRSIERVVVCHDQQQLDAVQGRGRLGGDEASPPQSVPPRSGQRFLPREQVAKEALYWSGRSRAERGAMQDYTRRTCRSPRRVPRRIASPSEPARLHITRWLSAPHSGTNRTYHRLARPFHGPPLSLGNLRSRSSVSRPRRPRPALTVPSPSQNRVEVNGAR